MESIAKVVDNMEDAKTFKVRTTLLLLDNITKKPLEHLRNLHLQVGRIGHFP